MKVNLYSSGKQVTTGNLASIPAAGTCIRVDSLGLYEVVRIIHLLDPEPSGAVAFISVRKVED